MSLRFKVIGSGWYGAHLATALLSDGHDVEVHEVADRIFAGASGNIPARLHAGALHYPRSYATRKACVEHQAEFMERYGFLTRAVPVNLYAIAADHSLIDFQTYRQILAHDLEFITVYDPAEFGLANVEGAVLTGERHILCDAAREHFASQLNGHVRFGVKPDDVPDEEFDFVIDATFCANSAANVDRYEPCLVVLLEGPTDKAVTIVDGPFGSLYPWDEEQGLCSLSSALLTPFSKKIRNYDEAADAIGDVSRSDLAHRAEAMMAQMAHFYPAVRAYTPVDYRLSVRAMPLSGADTRLVEVVRVNERLIRVRAGKIDAVIHAEKMIRGML